jgi:hypothetical protein
VLVSFVWLAVLFVTMLLRWNSLNYDEAIFYVPAIRHIASRLPRLTLDYPFAAPPVALHIQAILFRLAPENFALIKLFSAASALLVCGSVWYLVSRERPIRFAWTVFLMLTCFPFLLNSASQLKHHEFTIACLILGYAFWQRNSFQTDYRYLAAASFFFTAAVGSNQFAVVLPIALALHLLLFESRPSKVAAVLACIVPGLFLLACFFIWRGPQSPVISAMLEDNVGLLAVRPAHLVGILLTLGAWLFPVLKVTSKDMTVAAWSFVPSAVLVHLTGLFRPDADFHYILAGPVSTLLKAISLHSYALCVLLAAAVVACGIARTISLALDSRRFPTLFVLYATLFFATINFVPYYFESYYLYLILPAYLILLPRLVAANTDKLARVGQLSVGLCGIIYTVTKAIGNSV